MTEKKPGLSLDKAVEGILDAAEVATDDLEARNQLVALLKAARKLPGVSQTLMSARDHNEYLIDVKAAAAKLDRAMKRLEKNPKAHLLFLNHPVLRGTDEAFQYDIDRLLYIINVAANDALLKSPVGRPPKGTIRNLLELAYQFFRRFSKHQPSSTEGGRFQTAAQYFYEYAHGMKPSDGMLIRQTKTLLDKKRAEEAERNS